MCLKKHFKDQFLKSEPDSRFAYGSPVTALTAGPLTPGPVTQADQEGLSGTPPIVDAQYAASYAQYAQLPSLESAPIRPVTSSQFQAQDEAGNIAYGYQNVNSAKQERGNIHGGVEGSYSYVDEAGVHTVNYVADDLGFRIVGDNLPVAGVGIAPRFATILKSKPLYLAQPSGGHPGGG